MWFGAVDSLALGWGVPEIGTALDVEPEVRGVAEDAGEDAGGGGGDGAALIAEFVDVLARDAHGFGEGGLGEVEERQEFFDEDFADGDGFASGE